MDATNFIVYNPSLGEEDAMQPIIQFFLNLFKQRYYGVYSATVMDINDPEYLGRVLMSLPFLGSGGQRGVWARLATLMAGKERGTWFLPEVGDEVLVVFEGGDARTPYVVGSLWNAENPPPEKMEATGHNPVKSIHSRNGVVLSMYDLTGEEAFVLKTPGGQTLVLQDGKGGSVEIKDESGNQIRLSPSGIDVVASVKVSVNTSVLEVNAAMVEVNAGMSRFSGTVQVDTLITNSVISAMYSPGAGNIC
jgi:uncharacterized protein involved in type VI secretion and phage assembly